MLDGLLENDTVLRPREHYTDTHGFTEQLFGLCFLLGYSFMPRLRDLAVLLWYRQEQIPLCGYERNAHGRQEVVWRLPVYSRLLAILKNPVYAGAFAYGRTTTRSRMVEGRARKTAGHAVPIEQWAVLIRDHHTRGCAAPN